MTDISRRKVISRIAAGSMGLGAVTAYPELLTASQSSTTDIALTRAFRGQHQPRPLPFDPAKLKGLSEKLIRSHWENNYGGAVKALNAVEERLAAMLKEKDLPPCQSDMDQAAEQSLFDCLSNEIVPDFIK